MRKTTDFVLIYSGQSGFPTCGQNMLQVDERIRDNQTIITVETSCEMITSVENERKKNIGLNVKEIQFTPMQLEDHAL